jgi:hypothetical protein
MIFTKDALDEASPRFFSACRDGTPRQLPAVRMTPVVKAGSAVGESA